MNNTGDHTRLAVLLTIILGYGLISGYIWISGPWAATTPKSVTLNEVKPLLQRAIQQTIKENKDKETLWPMYQKKLRQIDNFFKDPLLTNFLKTTNFFLNVDPQDKIIVYWSSRNEKVTTISRLSEIQEVSLQDMKYVINFNIAMIPEVIQEQLTTR